MTRAMTHTNTSMAVSAVPADRHPVSTYITRLTSDNSRTSAANAIRLAQEVLTGSRPDADAVYRFPWQTLTAEHLEALRSALHQRGYAPASINACLAHVKAVLRSAWRLGLLDAEALAKSTDVPGVKGTRLPRGRSLSAGELKAVFATCRAGRPGDMRDAALLAILYSGGLRRAEAVALQVSDYGGDNAALKVRGKGDRERKAFLDKGAQAAVDTWLAVRGTAEGPLLVPVSQTGEIVLRTLTTEALAVVCKSRAKRAGIKPFSPHDLRRTFVGDLLDAGADVGAVQRLAGHADVSTTLRYDRRPEAAAQRAVSLIHTPVNG